ncbi:MAG: BA14K family protein [Pseudomonadota bacterium]|nr:BA14K family protein [Pseudomonadota bacterium]
MKLVSALAAACLAVAGFMVAGTAANAGGIEVRIYERHTSYRHYERVTVFSRHHGYRTHGHRLHRPGYVYHRGLWFSPRSMRAGVIVDRPIPRHHVLHYGGALTQHHYSWCANRYRSYLWRSNTFQPYHGPRRTCVSPYS